jgi:hypothetical protein
LSFPRASAHCGSLGNQISSNLAKLSVRGCRRGAAQNRYIPRHQIDCDGDLWDRTHPVSRGSKGIQIIGSLLFWCGAKAIKPVKFDENQKWIAKHQQAIAAHNARIGELLADLRFLDGYRTREWEINWPWVVG